MVEVRTQNALERGMDFREQATQAIAHLGDLCHEIVVEAAQQHQFGERVVREPQSAQRMGHRSGAPGDDRCIAGIGLGLTGVQIRNAAHRQARQIRHCDPFGTSDSDRQRTDRCRLVNDEQQRPMGPDSRY